MRISSTKTSAARRRCVRRLLLLAALASLAATPAAASVVVIANRMPEAVTVTAVIAGAPQRLKLDPGDSRPIFADAPVSLRLPGNLQDFQLAPDSAYFIGPD